MNVFPPVGRRISVRWVSSSFKVELNATTTLAALLDKIFDKWEKLIRIDFKLHNGETEAEINTDGDLTTFFKTTCPTIVVESLCKGFSKLEKNEVYSWASIDKIIEDNSHFEDIHIDIENEITSKVIEHALDDLYYKNVFYGPITGCLEASVREYISSVLLACARITGNVKLVAELDIAGRKGNGPLDFATPYCTRISSFSSQKRRRTSLKMELYRTSLSLWRRGNNFFTTTHHSSEITCPWLAILPASRVLE